MILKVPNYKGRSGVSIPLAIVLLGGVLSSAPQASRPPVSPQVLRYFEHASSSGPDAYLRDTRPAPLAAEIRARVLAGLPSEGESQPSEDDMPKLNSLQRVLQYHDRAGTVEIRVVRIYQAFVGLHARSIVLISEHALRLLNAEELQALVAHEMGHEYFWNEYALANQQGQTRRMRELELRCDGVAVITMAGLGLHPRHLISAVAKLNRFNARFGTPVNQPFYVSENERTRFIEDMAQLVQASTLRRSEMQEYK